MSKPTTCERIGRSLSRGERPDAGQIEHASGCEECAQRLEALELIGEIPAPPVDMAGLRSALEREWSPLDWLRSRSRGLRIGLLALLAIVVTGFQVLNMRADFAAYPTGRMIVVLDLLALSALWGWFQGLRPLHQRPPSGLLLALLGATLVAIPAGIAGLPEAVTGHAASHGGTGPDLLPSALACFVYGSVFGAPLLLLGALSDRTAMRMPAPSLAMLGGAALAGNLVLQIHCALTHPAHLLLGHASISVVFVIAGAALWAIRRRGVTTG